MRVSPTNGRHAACVGELAAPPRTESPFSSHTDRAKKRRGLHRSVCQCSLGGHAVHRARRGDRGLPGGDGAATTDRQGAGTAGTVLSGADAASDGDSARGAAGPGVPDVRVRHRPGDAAAVAQGAALSCCIAYMLAGPIINVVVISSTYMAFFR